MTVADQTKTNPEKASGYRYYVLGMLGLTYAFSYMDRQIVSILLGDIKAEFSISDTQLGLLSGLAFALFYATMAIPIARLADRHNRMTIISVAFAAWSIVTALCGAAQNFWQLFLGRVGVGVGEAGGLSPSHSVISDYFSAKERSFAISLFSLGTAVGSMFGLVMGGYVSENFGWRWAFVIAGLPGVLVAILLKLTVREPTRGAMETTPVETEAGSFFSTARSLVQNKIYRGILISHTMIVFAGYAIVVWLPEHMLRTFDVSKTEVGATIGLVFLVGTAGGMLTGGSLASYFARYGDAWQLRVPVIGSILSFPFFWLFFQQTDFQMAAIIFTIALFFFQMQHGPSLAVVQSYVEPAQRATAASLNFFSSNAFGLALGPLIVGMISDAFEPSMGNASLGMAIGCAIAVAIPGVYLMYSTSRLLGDR